MKKEKQQKRPKRTKAQRVQALKTFAVDTVYDVVGSILFAIGVYTFAKSADFAQGGVSGLALMWNYLWYLYARLVHRRHGFPHRHHQKA